MIKRVIWGPLEPDGLAIIVDVTDVTDRNRRRIHPHVDTLNIDKFILSAWKYQRGGGHKKDAPGRTNDGRE